jgi:hypothetical protein
MKVLIPILLGLLVVGCEKKEESVKIGYAKRYVESHFWGTYENNQNKNEIERYTLKENGRSFFYFNDVKCEEGEWKVVGGKPSKGEWIDSEIHIGDKYQWIVCSLNADHNLVLIATGSDTSREPRTRENLPKDEQEVYKKIQPKKFKTLEGDMVVGVYTATTKDEEGNDYVEKMVLFANGLGESFVGDKKASVAKWKIEGAHIKTIGADEWSGEIFRRTQNGNLSKVGLYYGGNVMVYSVDERIAWEKVKSNTTK